MHIYQADKSSINQKPDQPLDALICNALYVLLRFKPNANDAHVAIICDVPQRTCQPASTRLSKPN